CDIFCLPSVTGGNGDMEGIPVVLMEAMACGKIVVSTRHSGIPELIEDGVTGFLCEEKNVEELVEKIKFINSLGTRKKNIAVEARKKVVNDFNNEIIYADLDKIIKC
ncbi:glycosyltransferase, partial [Escherichia coli]|nr:glycosyltransferase [Escherichia coli]